MYKDHSQCGRCKRMTGRQLKEEKRKKKVLRARRKIVYFCIFVIWREAWVFTRRGRMWGFESAKVKNSMRFCTSFFFSIFGSQNTCIASFSEDKPVRVYPYIAGKWSPLYVMMGDSSSSSNVAHICLAPYHAAMTHCLRLISTPLPL